MESLHSQTKSVQQIIIQYSQADVQPLYKQCLPLIQCPEILNKINYNQQKDSKIFIEIESFDIKQKQYLEIEFGQNDIRFVKIPKINSELALTLQSWINAISQNQTISYIDFLILLKYLEHKQKFSSIISPIYNIELLLKNNFKLKQYCWQYLHEFLDIITQLIQQNDDQIRIQYNDIHSVSNERKQLIKDQIRINSTKIMLEMVDQVLNIKQFIQQQSCKNNKQVQLIPIFQKYNSQRGEDQNWVTLFIQQNKFQVGNLKYYKKNNQAQFLSENIGLKQVYANSLQKHYFNNQEYNSIFTRRGQCTLKEIDQYRKFCNNQWQERELIQIFQNLVEQIEDYTKKGVLHGDIRPDNIEVEYDFDDKSYQIFLSNFGNFGDFSKYPGRSSLFYRNNRLIREFKETIYYNKQLCIDCDIYSAAMTIFSLMFDKSIEDEEKEKQFFFQKNAFNIDFEDNKQNKQQQSEENIIITSENNIIQHYYKLFHSFNTKNQDKNIDEEKFLSIITNCIKQYGQNSSIQDKIINIICQQQNNEINKEKVIIELNKESMKNKYPFLSKILIFIIIQDQYDIAILKQQFKIYSKQLNNNVTKLGSINYQKIDDLKNGNLPVFEAVIQTIAKDVKYLQLLNHNNLQQQIKDNTYILQIIRIIKQSGCNHQFGYFLSQQLYDNLQLYQFKNELLIIYFISYFAYKNQEFDKCIQILNNYIDKNKLIKINFTIPQLLQELFWDIYFQQRQFDEALLFAKTAIEKSKCFIAKKDFQQALDELQYQQNIEEEQTQKEKNKDILIDETFFAQLEEPIEYAMILELTAEALSAQGKYAQADEKCRKLILIRKFFMGLLNIDIANSYSTLATTLFYLGKLNECRTFLDISLHLMMQFFSNENHEIATCKNNIAFLLTNQNQLDQSLAMHKEVLQIRQTLCIKNQQQQQLIGQHQNYGDVAISYNNLAQTYQRMNNYEESKKAQMQSIEIWRQISGILSLNMATAIYNFANIEICQKNQFNALKLIKLAYKIRKECLASQQSSQPHSDIIQTLDSLGIIYSRMEYYEKAKKYQKRSLRLWKILKSSESYNFAISLNNLSSTYNKMNEIDVAFFLCKRSLEIITKLFDSTNQNVINIKQNYESIKTEAFKKYQNFIFMLANDFLDKFNFKHDLSNDQLLLMVNDFQGGDQNILQKANQEAQKSNQGNTSKNINKRDLVLTSRIVQQAIDNYLQLDLESDQLSVEDDANNVQQYEETIQQLFQEKILFSQIKQETQNNNIFQIFKTEEKNEDNDDEIDKEDIQFQDKKLEIEQQLSQTYQRYSNAKLINFTTDNFSINNNY